MTRSSGKIYHGVIIKELEFWAGYKPDIVVRALMTHIDCYPDKKESYTRGIIKNMAADAERAPRPAPPNPPPAKRRFQNYKGRDYSADDIEAMQYLDNLKLHGLLEANREKLKKDPRYKKFLG